MPGAKTLFEACTPREEVLSGELTDEMFAARLSDVAQGKAHPIYQDPEQFFANTYPTDRVQSFLKEVLGRLSGQDPAASAFFRLDTPFGGGKTHTLITLYHLARSSLSQGILQRLHLPADLLPRDRVKVVTIVGDDLDPANGVNKQGVKVRHLWGDLAFQLGGPEGYALVEQSDVQGIAPGPQFLDQLVGNQPALILIDEPALYMRKMGDRAGQLPAFLHALTEWVTTSASRTVLVLTLAWQASEKAKDEESASAPDAFARETQELAEMFFNEVASVVNRPAVVVTPAERQDIAPILRQRLFKQVDLDAAPAVADAYFEALRQAQQREMPLPLSSVQASYRDALLNSYPFHPSLIETLDGKLATIPNFQKTRGVLRLLARVVRRLWEQKQADGLLIHPFSLDLADPDLVDEITGRLDRPAFRSVASYDVAAAEGKSHAQEIDQERFSGHPPYAQRIATTIFLHSLTEPPARGIDLDELMAATLTPGADPAHLQKALEEHLKNEAWHLDFEGNRYFFRTEPSLNKIVLDETNNVPQYRARAEVERRIGLLWRNAGLEVKLFPNEPSDLDDAPRGRLVLMHWNTVDDFKPEEQKLPQRLQELWEYKGAQRDYRRFRNTLFFLVADAGQQENMVYRARRYLALDILFKDSPRLDEYHLNAEHRQRLKEWRNKAELDVRVAITRAYRHLFYPVGESAEPAFRPFAYQAMQIEEQGNAQTNPTELALRALRELDKVKSADDPPRSPALVRRDTFGKDEGSLSLQTLFERFAERTRLPLLLEPTYLKEVVRLGVQGKEWLYYDQAQNLAYDCLDDLPDIAIDERHEVMTPETVKARNIPVYQKPRPESPPDDRKEPGDDPGHPAIDLPPARELKAEGEPRRALAELADRAKDARWPALSVLEASWSAEGRDAQARLSAVRTILGQLTAARAALDVDVTCEFPDGAEWRTQFQGPAERYHHLASTVENLVGQCRDAHANISIVLEFARRLPLSGAEYEDLRDILDLAGLGHTRFTARTKIPSPLMGEG